MRKLLRDMLDYFSHNKDYDTVGVLLLESDQLQALKENGHLLLDDQWAIYEDDITIIDKSEL